MYEKRQKNYPDIKNKDKHIVSVMMMVAENDELNMPIWH